MRVIIVGGGIIGLSIAYKLLKLGIDIVLLEKEILGKGASWVAGGMLAPQSEGLEGDFLQFCLSSREMYPSFVEEIESDTGIETGYWNCGILKLAFSKQEEDEIKKDIERYKKLGLKAEWLDKKDIQKEIKNIGKEVIGGALYEQDAQIDNRKLVLALANFVKQNAKVYEFEEVKEILTENGKFKAVKTDSQTVEGDYCVIAAGAWSGAFDLPVFPLKGEMAAVDVNRKDINRVLYSSKAYLIPRKSYNRLVIGATQEDVGFAKGNTVKGTLFLLNGLVSTLPNMINKNIQELWYGYRPATPDEFPILGEGNIKNLIYATGHHRNGILLAPITAKIISEYIYSNKISPYLEKFSINRF